MTFRERTEAVYETRFSDYQWWLAMKELSNPDGCPFPEVAMKIARYYATKEEPQFDYDEELFAIVYPKGLWFKIALMRCGDDDELYFKESMEMSKKLNDKLSRLSNGEERLPE